MGESGTVPNSPLLPCDYCEEVTLTVIDDGARICYLCATRKYDEMDYTYGG